MSYNKNDLWFTKINLQDELDMLLRKYEKKGVVVKKIDLVMLPPHPSKNSKPYTRVDFV